MKFIASSSLTSRRLKIVFAALCSFATVAVQGKEPLNQLVAIHESEMKRVDRPYLEITFSDNAFSQCEWVPTIEIDSTFYDLLSIEPIVISLLDEDLFTKKDSPFRIKKAVNFSRKIAKDEQEKLSYSFRDQCGDSILANPDLEKKSEEKHDFLSGKIKVEIEKEKFKSTTPFAFNEKKEKSDLIDRHFSHDKIEPKADRPKETIANVPSVQPSTIVSSTPLDAAALPKNESLDKHVFEDDQLFISFDDPKVTSQPFLLENSQVFDEKLSLVMRSYHKGKLEKQTSYADEYFSLQKGREFYRLQNEKIEHTYLPLQEENLESSLVETTDIVFSIQDIKKAEVSFVEAYVELNIPYSQFRVGKKIQLVALNSFSSFMDLPYFYTRVASYHSDRKQYMPTREKATPLPPKYPLSKGPTFALEFDDQVIAFAITPEFDLYVGEDSIELPKRIQEFEMSALAFLEPYLEMENEVQQQNSTPSPILESHEALALAEKEHHLDLENTLQSTDAFALHNEESLPIISHSLEFPHHTTQRQTNEFPIDDTTYLSTLMEQEDSEISMNPTFEEVPSTLLDKSFAFDMETEGAREPFTLSKEERLDFARFQYPGFPKLELGHAFSDINIHLKNSQSNHEFVNKTQSFIEYTPSTEKSKVSLNDISVVLLAPEGVSQSIPFDSFGGHGDVPMMEAHGTVHKFDSEHQLVSKDLGVTLPVVKQKDITPKGGVANMENLTGDLPGLENLKGLVARGERKYHVNASSSSPIPSQENELPQKLSHAFLRPSLPAYFPAEGMNPFQLETSYSAIKEEELNYLKEKLRPSDQSLEGLELPYVAGKKVLPNKAPVIFEKGLEDLAEIEKLVELAAREDLFPNSRKLVENQPVPVPVKNETDLITDEIASIETGMIHSQAKEILEDYDQENRFSHGLIALEDPSLEIGPKGAEAKSLNQSSRFTNGFLTEIPPPSHLETITYANEFDTEVHYSKREDGKGYHFAIKLKPNEKIKFASPSQNFIFVVDGSSSIKKHRYGVFKEGVARALTYLADGDSFNIVVADAKLRTFSTTSTAWDKSSVAKAKRFLLDQDYRGFFVNYDAFDLVSKVTQYFDPNRENVVVLITDGHSFNTLKHHKDDFKGLSEANNGKFSIFTATASQGNNLSMLDLLSTFNNGELMYSKTNASFSRQLSVLVKHIESFVAKNIHINVTGAKLETGIEFYPNEKTLPALYADRPYIIYGSIDELRDFDFLLQGRAGDQWINVKQSISFQHAINASHTIKKGMALQKAYVCYDYFMKNEDSFFLSEAQRILEPFNIPTAMR